MFRTRRYGKADDMSDKVYIVLSTDESRRIIAVFYEKKLAESFRNNMPLWSCEIEGHRIGEENPGNLLEEIAFRNTRMQGK